MLDRIVPSVLTSKEYEILGVPIDYPESDGEQRLYDGRTRQYLITYEEAEEAPSEAEARVAELEARRRILGEEL